MDMNKLIEPGERAGAIICIDSKSKTVEFAGYGVYKGNKEPPKGIKFMEEDLHELGYKNPKIDLDNGHTIWGCQCWWGSEIAIKTKIQLYTDAGYTVITVDPSVYSHDD